MDMRYFSSPMLGLSIGLMVLGPMVLWSLRWAFVQRFGYGPYSPSVAAWAAWALGGLPFAGLLVFGLGWLLVSAALVPEGNWLLGIGAGALVYLLIGLVWLTLFNTYLGTSPLALVTPVALLVALLWPLQLAQAFGWFGLRFN
jgi:hypothetical protein